MARPQPSHVHLHRYLAARRGAWLSILLVLGALAVAVALPPARGAAATQLDIVAVQHDPRGEIIASLRPPTPTSTISQVSALVDGAPRPASIISRPPAAAAVVIAIDTSASMAGAPLLSAQQAAMALADRLDPRDQVAVVAFSDRPRLLAPFSTDRAQTDAELQGLVAGGNTALYDTVAMSADLLNSATNPERVLVLLTDGQDFGSTLAGGRAASLQRIDATGAQVQSIALGSDADTTYLAQIANETHGGFYAVGGDASLNALFTQLGEQLAAPVQVAVQVPPLTRGDHQLEIRAQVDGATAIGTHNVVVTNDGVLTARVQPVDTGAGSAGGAAGSDTGMLVLGVTSVVPADTLTLQASAGGIALPVLGQPTRVLVDPWRFAPGPVDVAVTASIGGTTVSSADFMVTVPPLTPQLTVTPGGPGGAAATVTARVQANPPGAQLVARVDGREVARGPLPTLRLPAGTGGAVAVTLLDATGRTLATTTATLPTVPVQSAGGGAPPWTWAALAAIAALAMGGTGLRVGARRRARTRRRTWRPSAQTLMVGRRTPPTASIAARLGTVVVRPPAGGPERTYQVGRKPLSLGRSPECDIVIDDEAVGAVHARLLALGGGDFRVHGIAGRGCPGESARVDEWMVVRQGEQIAIGSYVLTLLAAEASVA